MRGVASQVHRLENIGSRGLDGRQRVGFGRGEQHQVHAAFELVVQLCSWRAAARTAAGVSARPEQAVAIFGASTSPVLLRANTSGGGDSGGCGDAGLGVDTGARSVSSSSPRPGTGAVSTGLSATGAAGKSSTEVQTTAPMAVAAPTKSSGKLWWATPSIFDEPERLKPQFVGWRRE